MRRRCLSVESDGAASYACYKQARCLRHVVRPTSIYHLVSILLFGTTASPHHVFTCDLANHLSLPHTLCSLCQRYAPSRRMTESKAVDQAKRPDEDKPKFPPANPV